MATSKRRRSALRAINDLAVESKLLMSLLQRLDHLGSDLARRLRAYAIRLNSATQKRRDDDHGRFDDIHFLASGSVRRLEQASFFQVSRAGEICHGTHRKYARGFATPGS